MKMRIKAIATLTIMILLTCLFGIAEAATYHYDDLGRLTFVTYDSGQSATYSYDSMGNMLSATNSLSNKLITAYTIAAQTGPATINSTNHTVALTVYNGTDVTNLVATFTLSDGASTQVGNTAQVSGTTTNNFTNPVIYKVIGADDSEQDWTVTVSVLVSPTSETLTVSNPTENVFTVALSPSLAGLTGNDFTLLDDSTPVTISSASTADNGATYTIAATLTGGKTYTVMATKSGYDFGTAQNVVVPGSTITETLTVSNPTGSGFTVALSPSLAGLTGNDFTLLYGSTPMTISSASTADNGATYTIAATLTGGNTYSVTATKTGYNFGTAQNVVVPLAAPTVVSAATTDSTHIVLTMSCALTNVTGDPVAFTVFGIASNPTVNSVAVSGTTITLALSAAIASSDSSIEVSYTKTGTNDLTNGNLVANFSNQVVTNNVP